MGMTNLQILLFVLDFSHEVIPRLRVFQRFRFAHKRHGGRLLCKNLPEAQSRIVSRLSADNIQISHQNIQIWRPAMALRSYLI